MKCLEFGRIILLKNSSEDWKVRKRFFFKNIENVPEDERNSYGTDSFLHLQEAVGGFIDSVKENLKSQNRKDL